MASSWERVVEDYRTRGAGHSAAAASARAAARRTEWLRLAAFLSAFVLVLLWFDIRSARIVIGILVAIALAAFLALVSRYRRLRAIEVDQTDRARFCTHGEARVRRDWKSLPRTASPSVAPNHPFANDLAVSGHASLWQLVNVVSAAPGRALLADWLTRTEPPEPDEIRARQEAARELAPQVEWREVLAMFAARITPSAPDAVSAFIEWSESEQWLHGRTLLRAWAVVSAIVGAASLIGLAASPFFLTPIAILLAVNGIITLRTARGLGGVIHAASLRAERAGSHRAMFAHLNDGRFESGRLQQLVARTRDGDAPRALQALENILTWTEVRHSSIAYPIVQLILLYDVHLAGAMERWKAKHGARVRPWFAALGEVETLAALSLLQHDNPDWSFPGFNADDRVEAKALGHPLISPATRIDNDVSLGPPGTFLLVTGSNMAGKTTYVRAIGLNVVLAQAGGPVCAQALALPRVRLHTSMHIHDSLEEGLSLFAAELLRLRGIVEAARTAGLRVLYLLDEVMRGTNAQERHIAVATIVQHLLKAGSIGAITTHDLALADEPALVQHAHPVHFMEHFESKADGEPVMRFDYTLREGVAGTTNALALLRIMGLMER